jgi:hypothetical protein
MVERAHRLYGFFALLPALTACAIDTRSSGNGTAPGQGGTGESAAGASGMGTGGVSSGGMLGAGGALGSGSSSAGGTTSSGGSVASGGAGASPVPPRPTEACPGLSFEEDVAVAGYQTDRFVWNDAFCKPREAAMMRVGGGYVRQFVYDVNGTPRVATGTGANGIAGWGYSVSHYGSGGGVGKDAPGTFEAVYVGAHHAIYEYKFSQNINGQSIPITFHWFFATGRSNPLLAITYDMTAAPAGSMNADIRTPYGDIAWSGDENLGKVAISGVGWGDRYRFKTTTAPLTMNSEWDYSEQNLVPYVHEWTDAPDAEMGVVQTQTYLQHDAGGYWYYSNWGKTSANRTNDSSQVGNMPSTWNWPYQLNQYSLCMEDVSCVDTPTDSHRLAWGTNYGAVGGSTAGSPMYSAFGDDKQLVGHPYQSYSVFMVLGKSSESTVFSQVSEIETVQKTALSASVGSVVTSAPGGVGRTDELALDPPGYDARYAVWRAQASGNALEFSAEVEAGSLYNPVLVVEDYTSASAPAITFNGETLTNDIDYVVSIDAVTQTAWITFRLPWTGSTAIEISGS